MRRYRWVLWSLILAANACGSTTVDQISSPGMVRCQIGLSSSTQDVPAAGSQFAVSVAAERECAWTAHSDASWVQPSPASGQGEGTLTLIVAANPQTGGRTATVTVNDSALSVSQAAAPAPCSFALSPATKSFSSSGGNGTVTVQTGAACTWTASANVTWITFPNAAGGTGPATVAYVVARNQSHQTRTGTITLGGRTHLVVQAGR